jgi:hypothetical protein
MLRASAKLALFVIIAIPSLGNAALDAKIETGNPARESRVHEDSFGPAVTRTTILP